MAAESEQIKQHFEWINKKLEEAYDLANEARKKCYDPEDKVDIPLARNMAERIEGLISAVAPQIVKSGMVERIHELEKEYGALDWRVALKLAEDVAKERFCKFGSKKEAMEVGIRSGLAYLTDGIVSAPLEGFIELKLKKTKDNKEYFAACYAGPIRASGATAAASSVIVADYVRVKMGYAKYDPTPQEVKRWIMEIEDYHERVTNLQYFPSKQEIEFLATHLPIEIDGDPTEKFDVSNYKDLERIETNKIRGGFCLVVAEGLSQKATKLWQRLEKWGKDFDLDWSFLSEFLALQKKIKAGKEKAKTKDEKITPNYTYIKDIVAGRPVLGHPMAKGAFRLRYGRTRTTGLSASAIHPFTQYLLKKYIAIGTQIKPERPGKGTAVTQCDSIEPPIVKLKSGEVTFVTKENLKECIEDTEEILFLGDILFNYGDFSENGHKLVPAGYCEEWWVQELEKAIVSTFGNLDLEKTAELVELEAEDIDLLIKNFFTIMPSAESSIRFSRKLGVPLHPKYTFHWNSINLEQFESLINWIDSGRMEKGDRDQIVKLILPPNKDKKRIIEIIGLPHKVGVENVIIEGDFAEALAATLNLKNQESIIKIRKDIAKLKSASQDTKEANTNLEQQAKQDQISILELINSISEIKIRDKSGTFIGSRMGRPEKSKMRELTGSPHMLFPVGDEGGRLRCIQAAIEEGTIKADFPIYQCESCGNQTLYAVCEKCNSKTKKMHYCRVCGVQEDDRCKQHGENMQFSRRSINIGELFKKAILNLDIKNPPELIKGVRGTSNKDHTPERLEKGILRAKHDIYVNKDGTTRYDMTELPITHFKPKEINVHVEKLVDLGYTTDIKGRPLKHKDQILELKPQDLILPGSEELMNESAEAVLFRVANFIDEELVKLYKLKPFYNLKSKEDLVGCLVIGLAPHISAGMISRIIGFSNIQCCYAHPLWHCGVRRDCDGDECCIILLMDALLNFSRKFLPDKRGGRTMDAPLVLTSKIIPSEVDSMIQRMDVVKKYPLEFYEAALQYKMPAEVEIEQFGKRIGKEEQYENIGFTHPVSDINYGINCSAYKTLPSMEEKLQGQMEIAKIIRAVDEHDVAKLVIEKHFLKDIKGNLRKFSMQKFRCSKCNEKFRRPPLVGKCTKCGGRIIFTIAEGSVIKYMQPSLDLAKNYNISPYLRQTLILLKNRIETFFGKEDEKQEGLKKWF